MSKRDEMSGIHSINKTALKQINARLQHLTNGLRWMITNLKRVITFTVVSSLLLFLTGCATYKSSFACGDAKGAYCASMDRVDEMINSGEIEQFNEKSLHKKYKASKDNSLSTPLKTKLPAATITNFEAEDAHN